MSTFGRSTRPPPSQRWSGAGDPALPGPGHYTPTLSPLSNPRFPGLGLRSTTPRRLGYAAERENADPNGGKRPKEQNRMGARKLNEVTQRFAQAERVWSSREATAAKENLALAREAQEWKAKALGARREVEKAQAERQGLQKELSRVCVVAKDAAEARALAAWREGLEKKAMREMDAAREEREEAMRERREAEAMQDTFEERLAEEQQRATAKLAAVEVDAAAARQAAEDTARTVETLDAGLRAAQERAATLEGTLQTAEQCATKNRREAALLRAHRTKAAAWLEDLQEAQKAVADRAESSEAQLQTESGQTRRAQKRCVQAQLELVAKEVEVTDLQDQLQMATDRLDDALRASQRMMAIEEDHQRSIVAVSHVRDQGEEALRLASARADAAEARADAVRGDLQRLEETLGKKEQYCAKLRDRVDLAEGAAVAAVARSEACEATLLAAYATADEADVRHAGDLEQLAREKTALHQTAERLVLDVTNASALLANAEAERDAMRSDGAALRNSQRQVTRECKTLTRKVELLESELRLAHVDLEVAHTYSQRLEAANDALCVEENRLDGALDVARKDRDLCRQAAARIEASRRALAQDARELRMDKEHAVALLDVASRSLEDAQACAKASAIAEDGMRDEAQGLRSRLADSEATGEALHGAVAEERRQRRISALTSATALATEVRDASTRGEALAKDLEDARASLEAMREETMSLAARCDLAEAALEAGTQTSATTMRQLEQLRAGATEAKEEAERQRLEAEFLRGELRETRTRLSVHDVERSELQSEAGAARDCVETVRSQLHTEAEKRRAAEAENGLVKRMQAVALGNTKRLEEQLRDAKETAADFTAQLEAAKTAAKTEVKVRTQLEDELATAETARDAAAAATADATARVGELEAQVTWLRAHGVLTEDDVERMRHDLDEARAAKEGAEGAAWGVADLAGHHNQKQRIHYVRSLREDLFRTQKENRRLERCLADELARRDALAAEQRAKDPSRPSWDERLGAGNASASAAPAPRRKGVRRVRASMGGFSLEHRQKARARGPSEAARWMR